MSPLNNSDVAEAPSVDALIAKGKRDLLCSEISSAVECFAEACEILSGKLGDLHDDLAMPNFLYGSALLELARAENTVFGESVKLEQDDDSSSDEVQPDENNEDKEEKEKSGEDDRNGAGDSAKKENVDNTNSEDVTETEEQEKPAVNEGQVEDAVSAEESEEKKDKADELPSRPKNETEEENDDEKDAGEISTLQLAWEVVEVARNIYSKHDDVEHKLKYADCLEKLGEIGQETGNHEGAIRDFLECLNVRMENDPGNHRLIAGSHFQLAIAYANVNDQHSADSSFHKALTCLEKCEMELETELNALDKDEESNRENVRELELRIQEVNGLINEIVERRKEVGDGFVMPVEPQQKVLQKDVPVDDISHLIKRKRPDDIQERIGSVKKARTEEGTEDVEKEKSS
ncbi:hypothetical protein Aperf_G00000010098 [Anoplocephala perfoliata]